MNTQEALNKLREGNERFATGVSSHPNQTVDYREEISSLQSPFALVLTCNDSRIAPELVFDQGLGDLSVIRIGGNIINDHIIGTVEYVLEHLNTSLIIVMGHTHCGAVTVAASAGTARAHIQTFIDEIKPAVEEARQMEGNLVDNAVVLNVKRSVEKLKSSKPFIKMMVDEGQVDIVGAVYDMETGRVEFL